MGSEYYNGSEYVVKAETTATPRANESNAATYYNGKEWVTRVELTDGGGTAEVAWADVTGKPSAYPPESHTHSIADVTSLQSALDGKAASGHTHSGYATEVSAITAIADPTTATAEDVANKVNSLIAALKA